MSKQSDYIEPCAAVKLRVFSEGDHWAIDAADADNECTAEVWTHWDDLPLTRETALLHVKDFAQYIGRLDLSSTIELRE